jgi:hypothetical protein
MKNTKVTKILALSFLFLTSHTLFSVKCAAQNKDKSSALYGPFGYDINLRKALIHKFKQIIDDTPYTLQESDIELGLTAEGEKAEYKAYVELPTALFETKDFAKISPGVAKALNEWLGKDVFSPSDFIPQSDDFPKGRNVDPQDQLGLMNKSKWLTIQEWIDRTYLRVVERAKDLLEARMQKYIEDSNANKKRQ